MVFILENADNQMVFASDNWGLLYERDKSTKVKYSLIDVRGLGPAFDDVHQIFLTENEDVPVGEMSRNGAIRLDKVEEKVINGEKRKLYKPTKKQVCYNNRKPYIDIEEFVQQNYVVPNVVDNMEEMEELINSVKDIIKKWENR